jgi:hypothetical protein
MADMWLKNDLATDTITQAARQIIPVAVSGSQMKRHNATKTMGDEPAG